MFAVYPLENQENRCFASMASTSVSRRKVRAIVEAYECRFCKREFTKQYNLLIHERTHRNGMNDSASNMSSCDICGKNFRKAETLKYHRMMHSPSPPLVPRELNGFLTECVTY